MRSTSGIGIDNAAPNMSPAETCLGIWSTVLTQALGSTNVFTASTVDQMPKQVSAGLMFGAALSIPIPDVDRTDYLLMLGANPYASNGSLCTAPDLPGRLEALRARGGKVVECPELAQGGTLRATFELLKVRGASAVVLVGHEPDLGRFLAAALFDKVSGAGTARFAFKKGGAACVEFQGRVAPGGATLLWMLPPKILRALR